MSYLKKIGMLLRQLETIPVIQMPHDITDIKKIKRTLDDMVYISLNVSHGLLLIIRYKLRDNPTQKGKV